MNSEQHAEAKAENDNFDNEWVKWIPIEDLEYDSEKSQFRVAGHATSKVARFAEILKERGWIFPPGTVQRNPNGTYQPKDMMTRLLAARRAGFKKVKVQLYTDSKLKTRDEWADFQAQANDHDQATPNSDHDIENHINDQVQNGALQKKLNISLNEEQSTTGAFIKTGAEHYKKEIFKNSGHNILWFKNRIKNALRGKVLEAFESYTKEGTALEYYKNKTGWQGTKIGDISQGRVLYVLDSIGNWSPNLVGNVITKLLHNPGVKVDIAAYQIKLAGKRNEDIVEYRKKVIGLFNQYNALGGIDFNALYFLPQMKRSKKDGEGNVLIEKDNMNDIIKAR